MVLELQGMAFPYELENEVKLPVTAPLYLLTPGMNHRYALCEKSLSSFLIKSAIGNLKSEIHLTLCSMLSAQESFSLLIMCPHPYDLDGSYPFQNLVYKPVLDIDAT
jgi:hypothetical protein